MSLSPDEKTLYISNLDKNVTDDILYELFLQAGPIERVNIVTSNTSSTNYGFVTYKHEISIDYAIQLYKDTSLFNKELSIKRRGDYGQHGSSELFDTYNNKRNLNMRQSGMNDIHKGGQNFRPNDDVPLLFNFKGNNGEGNWNRSKPYDHGSRKYSSRSYDDRRRYKSRDVQNKPYHSRNRWH